MITGVQDVYYEVQDIDYRQPETLPDPSRDGAIESLDTHQATTSGLLQARLPGARVVKFFNAILQDDIRADAKRLRDKGIRFASEIGDYAWGSVVTFEDSEGNFLKLMQPPK